MIYGKPQVRIVNDTTDFIGIRTLVLEQMWQPLSGAVNQADLDAEKPPVPVPAGGVLLVGEQCRPFGGAFKSTWTFQGIQGDGKSVTFKDRENSLDYSFEPGFSQIPIQLHPDFQSLLASYDGQPDNEGARVIWPPTLGGSGGQQIGLGAGAGAGNEKPNPMFGVQDYFRMEGTYRHRYAGKTLPNDLFDDSGRAVPSKSLGGEPPELTEGRNWLKVPPTYRRRGAIFEITEMFWLSGPRGWPVPVYGNAK